MSKTGSVGEFKHPAKFSQYILEEIHSQIRLCNRQLRGPRFLKVHDPFAGTGRIHRLHDMSGFTITTTGMEIEPEWASMHESTVQGDSSIEEIPLGTDWIATSPCYGNRMADTLLNPERKDYTYTGHYSGLGRKLNPSNAGGMQWGERYRELHEDVYARIEECPTVQGMTINIKDHIRKGKPQGVDKWHTQTLLSHGWTEISRAAVGSRGQRHGTNKGALIGTHEWVITFKRDADV